MSLAIEIIRYVIGMTVIALAIVGAASIAIFTFGPREYNTTVPIEIVESPGRLWKAEVVDERWERGLFPIITVTTRLYLEAAQGPTTPVKILDSFTDLRDGLRPKLIWLAPNHLCVVTPQIDRMSFRSGDIAGVRVELHVLRWNQKWPPPKIDLDAQCR